MHWLRVLLVIVALVASGPSAASYSDFVYDGKLHRRCGPTVTAHQDVWKQREIEIEYVGKFKQNGVDQHVLD